MSYRELLQPYVQGLALERLVSYAELLVRWSARHNLVSYSSPEELVERHLLDSIAGAPLVPCRSLLLDVGSGAGLPGVPLLCVVDGLRGVLVEPRSKRWSFLRAAIRVLELEAEVVRARIEDLGSQWGGIDRVTARAVGNHRGLLSWSRSRLAAGGGVLLWITEPELNELRRLAGWRVVSCALPRSDRGRLAFMQPCST
jgi:16S rRNA (guanine527-N7)-methyltransferase